MKRNLTAIFLLLCTLASASTVNTTVTFSDFLLNNIGVTRVNQTPISPWGDNNGTILIPIANARVTVVGNNSVTFSNTVAGYAYRLEFFRNDIQAKPLLTITNGYPPGLSGNVNAHD